MFKFIGTRLFNLRYNFKFKLVEPYVDPLLIFYIHLGSLKKRGIHVYVELFYLLDGV